MNIRVHTLQTGVWAPKKMFPNQQTMNAATPTIYHDDGENATVNNKMKMKDTVYFTQQKQWKVKTGCPKTIKTWCDPNDGSEPPHQKNTTALMKIVQVNYVVINVNNTKL